MKRDSSSPMVYFHHFFHSYSTPLLQADPTESSLKASNQPTNHLLAGEDTAGEEGDAELLVDHEGEDAHHGGTALVELDGALLELGLLVEGVPAEIDEAVAEVADEFTGLGAVGGVLHDEGLEEADEGEELEEAGSGDVLEGLESGGDVGEVDALAGGDGSGETDAGGGGKVTGDGEHGDATVLDLDVTETVEVGLITVGDEAKRIVEAKGGLGSELFGCSVGCFEFMERRVSRVSKSDA